MQFLFLLTVTFVWWITKWGKSTDFPTAMLMYWQWQSNGATAIPADHFPHAGLHLVWGINIWYTCTRSTHTAMHARIHSLSLPPFPLALVFAISELCQMTTTGWLSFLGESDPKFPRELVFFWFQVMKQTKFVPWTVRRRVVAECHWLAWD